jgi:hypothetical protein
MISVAFLVLAACNNAGDARNGTVLGRPFSPNPRPDPKGPGPMPTAKGAGPSAPPTATTATQPSIVGRRFQP